MRHSKAVVLGNRSVEVRELTVGELRKMLRDSKAEISGMTMQDLVLGDGLQALAGHFEPFTSLKAAEIDELTLSEIGLLSEAIKEVNPDFFALVGGLAGLLETLGMPSATSINSVASSLSSATEVSLTTDGASSGPSVMSRKKRQK
jgi:hypothetical protein